VSDFGELETAIEERPSVIFSRVKSVWFFFPKREVGGVQMLFLRMAEYIVDHYGYDVMLIDFPDGFMAQHSKHEKVTLIPFVEGRQIEIPSDAVLVLQSMPLWWLREEVVLNDETRVALWTLFPYNMVVPVTYNNYDAVSLIKKFLKMAMDRWSVFMQKRNLKKFIEFAAAKKAIYFMDEHTLNVTLKANSARIDAPIFLPVPSIPSHLRKEGCDTAALRCGWLGRLCDFKATILRYTLRRTARFAFEQRLHTVFHIIGDGPERSAVEACVRDISNSFFSVVFTGSIVMDELDRYLLSNVDILFAMGTSALEGARLGIPVVLTDGSYSEIAGDYVYKLLSQTQRYYLGEFIRDRHFAEGNSSLESLLSELRSDYARFSQAALDYFSCNHSLDKIAARFISLLEENDLSKRVLKESGILTTDIFTRALRFCLRIRRVLLQRAGA